MKNLVTELKHVITLSSKLDTRLYWQYYVNDAVLFDDM